MKGIYLIALFLGVWAATPTHAATVQLTLDNFKDVSLYINAKVNLKQGPVQEVTVTGNEADINGLSTQIVNGKWEIKFNGNAPKKYAGVVIDITLPSITGVSVYGSGTVKGVNKFSTTHLSLVISGSGSIDLVAHAEELVSEIKGSGNIKLDGGAKMSQITISGSGNVVSQGLVAEKVSVLTAGSGNAYVYATGALNVNISGSGNVYYQGNPTTDVAIKGSGRVSKEK